MNRSRFVLSRSKSLAVVSLLVGCGGENPAEPNPNPEPLTVSTVAVMPSNAELVSIEDTIRMTASALAAGGQVIGRKTFVWASNDELVATVDGDGLVTALANGTAQISATTDGVDGSATATVDQKPAVLLRVSGDLQFATVDSTLDSALVVEVQDERDHTIAGVEVEFSPLNGAGTAGSESGTTDDLGRVSTTWTPGTTAGIQEMQAFVAMGDTISTIFTVTATADDPTTFTILSGNAQSELPSFDLPEPVIVAAWDQFANPVPDVMVTFAAPDGSITPTEITTDLNGEAQALWTLGPALGQQAATAEVPEISVALQLEASAVSLSLDAIGPASIVVGDTVEFAGSGFHPDYSANVVLIDGREAELVTGSQGLLSAIVPSFGCVAARDVDITVGRDAFETNVVSGRLFPADALELEVGQARILSEGFCLQFLDDAVGGDEYIVGVSSTTPIDAEMTFSIIGSDATATPAPPLDVRTVAGVGAPIHGWTSDRQIREWERLRARPIYRTMAVAATESAAVHAMATPVVGEALQFRVPDIGGDLCSDFVSVTTTVRAVGTNVVVITDDANPADDPLSESDVAEVVTVFEQSVSGIITEYFGELGDIDQNQSILVVVSSAVNAMGTDAFTTAADLLDRNECASSDGGEILYVAAPDPAGSAGPVRTRLSLMTSMPSALARQLTYATQLSRRFAAGGSLLAGWLAEAQAELAQEVVGLSILGDASGNDYGSSTLDGGPAQALWYGTRFASLSNYFGWDGGSGKVAGAPGRCSLFAFESASNACVGAYGAGAAWSFARYVTDRFAAEFGGEAALHRAFIDQDPSWTGVDAVVGVLGVEFGPLLADWAATLYLDGRVAASSAGTRQMSSWNLRDIYDAMPAERRLQPPDVSFASFNMVRTIVGGGTAYTRLASAGAHGPLAVSIEDGAGGTLGSLMAPLVWVVRIQ